MSARFDDGKRLTDLCEVFKDRSEKAMVYKAMLGLKPC